MANEADVLALYASFPSMEICRDVAAKFGRVLRAADFSHNGGAGTLHNRFVVLMVVFDAEVLPVDVRDELHDITIKHGGVALQPCEHSDAAVKKLIEQLDVEILQHSTDKLN